jgi:hypothetical protein
VKVEILLMQRKYDEALEMSLNAIKLNPDSLDLRLDAAQAYREKGKPGRGAGAHRDVDDLDAGLARSKVQQEVPEKRCTMNMDIGTDAYGSEAGFISFFLLCE